MGIERASGLYHIRRIYERETWVSGHARCGKKSTRKVIDLTGDYWLIPARTATGDVEWPGPPENPEALPPHGIKHHYAPLHGISVAAGGTVTANATDDQRRQFDGQAKSVRP